jgi:hypothetical protein
MTKYINKNMSNSNISLNAHLFYHSLHLKQYALIGKGILNENLKIKYSFENEYVKKLNFTNKDIFNNILMSIKL